VVGKYAGTVIVLEAAATVRWCGCYTICITMRFEWDSRKNRINQTKHNGLDFETAAHVFDDPNVMFMEDRVVEGEQP